MVARGFINVIDDWFKQLTPTPSAKNNRKILERYRLFNNIIGQAGRLGMAAFLATFAYTKGPQITVQNSIYAVAIGLVIWSAYFIIRPAATRAIFNRITSNIVPSIIIMTKADDEKYNSILNGRNSSRKTAVAMTLLAASNIILNIVASFIWQKIGA